MPKSKHNKKPRKQQPPPPPIQLPWWKRHWKALAAIAASVAAVVGFASAVATFLPRVSIDIGEPIDSANALTAPITVTNTFVPLERASLSLGLCQLSVGGWNLVGANKTCEGGSGVHLMPPPMVNHHLGTDDKWRVLFRDFIDSVNTNFASGDVTMVIKYTPWPFAYLHMDWLFRREKQFRFTARKAGENRWQWFPNTIDK
jgi:hypothetical protein